MKGTKATTEWLEGADALMVLIIEYDRQWPRRLRKESKQILEVVGDLLIDIEHIGSTSVEGFAAKPVVDMAGAVERLEAIASIVDPLADLGYKYYGEYGLPDRHFFVRHSDDEGFHLHVVQHGSSYWRRYIAFRDALRESSKLRDEYAKLKRELATQFADDPDAYSRAKSEFVEQIVGEGCQ